MSLRAVLVGCGAMSAGWLEALADIPEVSVAGFADTDLTRARAAADRQGGAAHVGTEFAQVIEAVHPDMVFDVALPATRHALVSLALSAGCHVLTEKPMAETLEQARDLVARARAAGRIHAVIQNRRYLAGVRRIRRLLASGALGRVTSLHCDFFLAPHFGGFRETMRHVLLLDMAIHTFDAARCMSGLDATAVYCREWNPPGSWYQHGSSAAATFEMSDGVVFTYRGSWCAEGFGTSWESAWRIVCERGSLVWDGNDDIRAEAAGPQRTRLFDAAHAVAIPSLDAADAVGGHLGVLRDFVAAVQGGPAPETEGADNIRSLAMVVGAISSAETGTRVRIDG